MPKKNSTVKAVRIDNDKLAELEGKLGEQTINSWLNEQIEKFLSAGRNEPKGVNPSKNSQKSSESPYLEEIEEMVRVSGMTMEEFYRDLDELMIEGTIDMSGKLSVKLPEWAEEITETCRDCGIRVEEAMAKAAKALRKGII